MSAGIRRPSAPAASPASRPASQAGVTLLEVLITLVVLSIGLLGLAGLQTVSLQLNQGAVVRSQAANLAYDITERMRANWDALDEYVIDIGDDPDSTGDLVEADLTEWRTALARMLPQGTGSVAVDDRSVTVVVQWLGTNDEGTEFTRDETLFFEFRTEL